MGKIGKRFFTAKFAEGAEVEGEKHETRNPNPSTGSGQAKFQFTKRKNFKTKRISHRENQRVGVIKGCK
jgi:hypothetical protein